MWPASLSISTREGLVPAVPPVPVPVPVPIPTLSPPAALAELVAVDVSFADSAAAAVGINVADAIRADTAANIVDRIAASAAARGVLLATPPVTAAATGAIVPVPTPSTIAVSLIAPAPSPPASLTVIGTALSVPATWIPSKATALDEGVVVLSEPEVGPSQRGQRDAGSHHLLQGRAPVLKSPQHARPVVETAFVHGLSLLSSL